MVCTAWEIAWSRAAISELLRQLCRASASVSRAMMTVRPPSPCAKREIHCWYCVRSLAPPALAPPQSRLGISYALSTGTWLAEFAALTSAETSEVTVLRLNDDSQCACG